MERRLRVILSQPCLGKGEKVSNSFQQFPTQWAHG